MQWFIDIIKEWVIAQGYLTAAWVNRGDPAAFDFVVGDLILNDAWHDMDLSGIVPAGATFAYIRVSFRSTGAGKQIQFRENGNANENNKRINWTQVANLRNGWAIAVALDSDRVIEYRVQDDTFNQINVCVAGWSF